MLNRAGWKRRAAAALLVVAAALPLLEGPAKAQRAGALVRSRRADFADMAAGTYFGDVTSDARGSSRSGVRVTVVRIGPNRVRVSSDHSGLRAFTISVTRAMDMVQNAGGKEVFRLDLSKSPRRLAVTVDGASWAGVRE